MLPLRAFRQTGPHDISDQERGRIGDFFFVRCVPFQDICQAFNSGIAFGLRDVTQLHRRGMSVSVGLHPQFRLRH